jgi:hypothetical protein
MVRIRMGKEQCLCVTYAEGNQDLRDAAGDAGGYQ